MTPKFDEMEEVVLMRIMKLRKSRGLTQADIGQRLGLTTSQISRMESGQTRLTVSSLLAYCEAMSISPSTLWSSEALDESNQGSLSRELAAARQEIDGLKAAARSAIAALEARPRTSAGNAITQQAAGQQKAPA